jgi:hypothetical protein
LVEHASLKSPSQPPGSFENIQAPRNGGAWGCPGKGKFPAAKTGAYFSVARSVWNPRKPKDLFWMDKSLRKLPPSLCGSPGSASGPCISRRVLTAGNLSFPGQRKGTLPPCVQFSHSFPLKKGAKESSVCIRVHPCPNKSREAGGVKGEGTNGLYLEF